MKTCSEDRPIASVGVRPLKRILRTNREAWDPGAIAWREADIEEWIAQRAGADR